MKRNIIILIIIGMVSLIAGSIIYFAVGLNGNEEIRLSGKAAILVDTSNYQAVSQAAASFKEIHPRVEIEVIKANDTYGKTAGEISAGHIGEDLFIIPEEYTRILIKSSATYFLDMTQEIAGIDESYSKGKLEVLTYNKKIYGIPWLSEPMLIMYRSDIFSVEGIDVESIKTWDDFRETGKALSKSTGKKFLIYNGSQFDRLKDTMLSQLRINYSAKENYTRVNDLINGMVADKTLQAVSSIAVSSKQGTALAVIVSPYDAIKIMNSASALGGKWGAMKLPAFEPGGNRDVTLSGYNLLVNKNTKNVLLAKEFAKYLSTDREAALNNLKKHGSFSSAYTIYDDDAFSFSTEYFNMDLWSFFADIEENSPQNIYE
ncbi:MAG: ABC transporter substrate-binding protein [Clostridiaceae bacterium]